ncbi:MAG: mannonate dehydratase [Chloroflexi bacterium]|nr:mannonate dehydratase [Chloroflexota bacterium]
MLDLNTLPMRLAIGQVRELTDEIVSFSKQMGIHDMQFNFFGGSPYFPSEARWEYMDLLRLRTRVEDAGLRLNGIENVPIKFYDKIMLGKPGRDEQIENMQTTIRNMGRAGIPIFGYHFVVTGVWRTSSTARTRGDALTTAFDLELAKDAPLNFDREYTDDEMWANYEYFIKAMIPVAEEAGVQLALHPDDPPVESLGGVARIMRSFEAFDRAMTIGDSPNHGLDFCVGSWSEMSPEECKKGLKYFGEKGKIFYVHFRDVLGTVPKFREAFIGEGNLDMFDIMKTLRQVGFKGYMIDDHVPAMTGDSGWASRSRAFANGQMSAYMEILNSGAFD